MRLRLRIPGLGLRAVGALAVLSAVFAIACSGAERPAPRLELVAFQQAGSREVCLNETLVLHFSRPLERASVTSASVRIVDDGGQVARGQLRVDRRTVTFTPELPRRPDVEDGGLRPGRWHQVELGGFPRPDGVRSSDGAMLTETLRLAFRTAERDGSAPLFVDTFSGRPGDGRQDIHPVRPLTIGPLDPIVLISEYEGVDPRSLRVGEFALVPLDAPADATAGEILLEPRLAENGPNGARIELHPVAERDGERVLRVLEPGTWYLGRLGRELATLGGRTLEAPWDRLAPVRLEVREPDAMSELVTFESARRWYEDPVDFDGTAHWPAGVARVSLRYPAAAGDGRDGALVPLSAELVDSLARGEAGDAPVDLQATRFLVGAGTEVDLPRSPGLVVLRSQGALEVRGSLVRELDEPFSMEQLELALEPGPDGRETLSRWLERTASAPVPWTVLVAGGDLRISGRLRVDGPLVLVAGGHIRVEGQVDAPSTWKSAAGGVNIRGVQELPLVIDAPEVNRLREPLRVAVFTSAIRPASGVRAWLRARPIARNGGGAAELFFVGLRDRVGSNETDAYAPVGDLSLLGGCDALRLLVVLSMPAGSGEAWDPPDFEAVELSWMGRSPQGP